MNSKESDLYSSSCQAQAKWAKDVLAKSLLKQRDCKRILDIGCGPGDVTKDIILSRYPDVSVIYAIDESPEMIECARRKNSHPKIQYGVALAEDMTSWSPEWNSVDLVTSFATLHFVKDQKRAIKNIFDVLKPGGEFILYTLFEPPRTYFDVCTVLAKRDTWEPYLKDFVPECYSYWEPVGVNEWRHRRELGYQELCEDAGLHIYSSEIINGLHAFETDDHFKGLLRALLTQVTLIPDHLVDAFMDDVLAYWVEQEGRTETGQPYWDSKLLVVQGQKPNE